MRGFCVILSCAILTGCGGLAPGHYALSAHEAFARLKKADLADFIFANQCGILIHATADPQPDRSVIWHIKSEGQEMVSFTALLTPVAEQETVVEISVSKTPEGKEKYDGSYDYFRPAFHQPLRPAIGELIDSVLTGRKYDPDKVVRDAASDGGNSVCNVQRAGLEEGIVHFSVHDQPGQASFQ